MIWLTYNLFVGEAADVVWLDGLELAETPGDAVRIIEVGKSALLPYDDWVFALSLWFECFVGRPEGG